MSRTTRDHQPHYYWLKKPHTDKLLTYIDRKVKEAVTYNLHCWNYKPEEQVVAETIEYATKIWRRMHRDYDWNGGLKRNVKHASKKSVRVAARAENYHLMRDVEYITRPHEYEQRGEIWNWD